MQSLLWANWVWSSNRKCFSFRLLEILRAQRIQIKCLLFRVIVWQSLTTIPKAATHAFRGTSRRYGNYSPESASPKRIESESASSSSHKSRRNFDSEIDWIAEKGDLEHYQGWASKSKSFNLLSSQTKLYHCLRADDDRNVSALPRKMVWSKWD